MVRLKTHMERHRVDRVGWLRAAVLGANDGLVSTASLVAGVAAAGALRSDVLLAGVAGLVAGAMSMAAGEYVSVSSQSDTEKADLARERAELSADPDGELEELAGIYAARGVSPELALKVAVELTARDGLGAHARDELGISEIATARPIQAALTSAATFALGALPPLLVAVAAPQGLTLPWVMGSAVMGLAALGVIGARIGGANVMRSVLRVVFWGVAAMGLTSLIGRAFGAVV
ncbi:VIT family protein [Brevundimonas sp.]|uniref:VIT1/CCC1 transporter family protein n=1 Tax=Brevundimonas sp. TaxID=1871086 RepID=UPI002628D5EA|nr:VIT family protein [Brevundimonas sp.]